MQNNTTIVHERHRRGGRVSAIQVEALSPYGGLFGLAPPPLTKISAGANAIACMASD